MTPGMESPPSDATSGPAGQSPLEQHRRHRLLLDAAIGAVVGCALALVIFSVVARTTNVQNTFWWWIAAAFVGTVGGMALAPFAAIHRDVGEDERLRALAGDGADGAADTSFEGQASRDQRPR